MKNVGFEGPLWVLGKCEIELLNEGDSQDAGLWSKSKIATLAFRVRGQVCPHADIVIGGVLPAGRSNSGKARGVVSF
jgi:hypothetical protein